jgi:glucose/arabinose dehydrogenase
MKLALLTALAIALAGCSQQGHAQGGEADYNAAKPNGRGQKPAFAGQTRAPLMQAKVAYDVVDVAKLDSPWGLQFLPDGRMLVTLKGGRLVYVTAGGKTAPISGVPAVHAQGQSGLLDVALDPAYPANHRVYLSYLESRNGGYDIAVARGELNGDALTKVTVIFHAEQVSGSTTNVGSRLAFAPDGTLFVSVGDRFSPRDKAQDLSVDSGKIVRITTDGQAPPDNPFVGKPGARPEIWSYGHRNPQGLAINPATHVLWEVEHGARGGDEINIPQKGKNYGWPVITYGIDYSGLPIGEGTQKPGMEQPIYYWDPVIAPSGMAFYTGDKFPAWKGSLFVGGLAGQALVRLTLKGDKVIGEERLLRDHGVEERIRDVRHGPDGLIYVLTDGSDGRLLKLVPKQ